MSLTDERQEGWLGTYVGGALLFLFFLALLDVILDSTSQPNPTVYARGHSHPELGHERGGQLCVLAHLLPFILYPVDLGPEEAHRVPPEHATSPLAVDRLAS